MNTIDSSSAVESSMEAAATSKRRCRAKPSSAAAAMDEEKGGDPQVWRDFNESFGEVQNVLDRNRALIQQVNENHQSRIPDNMLKNVALIQELNGNISKVVSLYSDLSTNFSSCVHTQRSQNSKPETPPQR